MPLRRRIGDEWESHPRSVSLLGAVKENFVARIRSWGIWDQACLRFKLTKNKKDKEHLQEHAVALRAEFVLKPGKEGKVHETIDEIVSNSFSQDKEFLQGLVMVSEMESRLVTVITFWHQDGFAEARARRVRWLSERLAPYLDKSMRVQAFSAHVMEAKPAEILPRLENAEQVFSLAS